MRNAFGVQKVLYAGGPEASCASPYLEFTKAYESCQDLRPIPPAGGIRCSVLFISSSRGMIDVKT